MKVLFVTVSISSYDTGETIYSYGILDRLAGLVTLDILTYDTKDDENYRYYLERLCNKVNQIYRVKMDKMDLIIKYLKYHNTFVRYSREMERKVEELLRDNNYDAVIINHLRMGFVTKTVKNSGCKAVLVEHNIETQNYREQLRLKGHMKYRVKNWGIPKFENNILRIVDAIWCITEKDLKLLKTKTGLENKIFDVIIPYFPYKRIKTKYEQKKILVIMGTMNWYPNIEGTQWFVNTVFKELLKKDSAYKLYIVGRNPDKRIIELKSDNIIVTGGVPSVDEYLQMADFLIVPNTLGSGAKIKIIEGVLKGIPCISLSPSITGYEDVVPDHDFIVNDEREYLDRILTINADKEKKESFVDRFIDNITRSADLDRMIERLG